MWNKTEAHESEMSRGELKEEHAKEIVDRETTSFVNAENIIEDSQEQRLEKGDEETSEEKRVQKSELSVEELEQ